MRRNGVMRTVSDNTPRPASIVILSALMMSTHTEWCGQGLRKLIGTNYAIGVDCRQEVMFSIYSSQPSSIITIVLLFKQSVSVL